MRLSLYWLRSLLGSRDLGASQVESALQALGWSMRPSGSSDPDCGGDVCWEAEPPASWPLPPGHVATARALAAVRGQRFDGISVDAPAAVDLTDMSKVMRLTLGQVPDTAWAGAVVLVHVLQRQSPTWLQERMRCLGFGSRGALVDASTLVSCEFGVEVFALDLDAIDGGNLVLDVQDERNGGARGWKVRDALGVVYSSLKGVAERCEVRDSSRRVVLLSAFAGTGGGMRDRCSIRSQGLDVLTQAAATATRIVRCKAMSGMAFETRGPWSPAAVLLPPSELLRVGLVTQEEVLRGAQTLKTLGFGVDPYRDPGGLGLHVRLEWSSADGCDTRCVIDLLEVVGRARRAVSASK